MREYGQIQCAWWGHPDTRGLDDAGKTLSAYLMTGPHSNGLGCYYLPDGYVMADLGWSSEKVSKGFRELIERGFCKRCEVTEWVLIPKFLRWNPISNPKVAVARIHEFKRVPPKATIYPDLITSIARYASRHMPADFIQTIHEASKRVAFNVPRSTRDFVFDRDGKTCCRCGSTDDLTLDHIFPVAIGGTHAVTNLRVACRPCNSARPVAGEALEADLKKDGYSMADFDRICGLSEGFANAIERVSKQEPNPNPDPKPTRSPSVPSADGTPRGKKEKYSQDFEGVWVQRLKRESDDRKDTAWRAYNARRKEGIEAGVLLEGYLRYRNYIRAIGKEGTRHVLQMATFFGPADPPYWERPWEVNGATPVLDWKTLKCLPSPAILEIAKTLGVATRGKVDSVLFPQLISAWQEQDRPELPQLRRLM